MWRLMVPAKKHAFIGPQSGCKGARVPGEEEKSLESLDLNQDKWIRGCKISSQNGWTLESRAMHTIPR